MRRLLVPFLLLGACATAQTVVFTWPNTPCPVLMQCDTGCTACNQPTGTDASFIVTNLAHTGVSICPINDGGGDNVVASYGWGPVPDSTQGLFLTAIALQPLHIDSLVIVHSSTADGPQHVQVSVIHNNGAEEVVGDLHPTATGTTSVFSDLGCVAAGPGMAYGTIKIWLRPFGGNGAWYLDDLRIATDACATTNDIGEIMPQRTGAPGPMHDVLGRPVNGVPASGAYAHGARRVLVP